MGSFRRRIENWALVLIWPTICVAIEWIPFWSSPERALHISPGQRPGWGISNNISPERAWHKLNQHVYPIRIMSRPYRGQQSLQSIIPRTLPWAGMSRPFRPLNHAVSPSLKLFRTFSNWTFFVSPSNWTTLGPNPFIALAYQKEVSILEKR